ncbi:MAG: helix-turn-helix transcriptional regulator [Dehalococcoidia bacterium]
MPEGAEGFAELTEREREVLPLLAQQLTNEEIAEALVISSWTVKRHVSSILGKLHVPNRKKAGQLYREEMARDG